MSQAALNDSSSLPASAAVAVFDPREPIPGYRLEERIGAGGYGEVWRATAPGGLAKAVKIVYGCRDDVRAQRELSALNRIKAVGHPFLLSIDRIELLEGHLVIVTELASSTLKQLFEHSRAQGHPGIPRETLLLHLRDAADALDYICQEHALQHLDVKPENLLLVGGRVKVADFGLVKDLQDVQSSVVGGLTPLYAAPEIFDGRPNDRSDQYSLAIVFQELLTGTLPFQGRTTAQLAAQHLHSKPRLDSLALTDQATIARALSKQPAQRFSSCRELIDRLLSPTAPARPAPPVTTIPRSVSSDAVVRTEVLSPDSLRAVAQSASSTTSLRADATHPSEAPLEPTDLPPLPVTGAGAKYRPTVVIGVGGVGAQTLLALERRLSDRFNGLSQIPAVQPLLLDTDPLTIKSSTSVDQPVPLENDAVLLLPLRQPSDYRQEQVSRFHWLSRRWIFNIPRSLETEGFRPLGRLALADHSQRVAQHVRRVLDRALDPQAALLSAQQTGLPFEAGPARVFVVASTTGGTGSGMALDLGYLVRQLLGESAVEPASIFGLLAHGTGRNPRARELAVANSYACLTEWAHFADPQVAFPGDPSSGLQAVPGGLGPFDHTYWVSFGEELDAEGFQAGAEKLAEFIYLNSVAPAAEFFDAARCPSAAQAEAPVRHQLRTFGTASFGLSADALPAPLIDGLCLRLLLRWRTPGDDQFEQEQVSMADPNRLLAPQFAAELSEESLRCQAIDRCRRVGLEPEMARPQLLALAQAELGSDLDSYLVAVVKDLTNNYQCRAGGDEAQLPGAVILETLDSLMRQESVGKNRAICLETALEAHLQRLAADQARQLEAWVDALLASPEFRLAGAQRAASCLVQHLRTLGRDAQQQLDAPRARCRALREQIVAPARESRGWVQRRGWSWNRRDVPDKALSELFRLQVEELATNGVSRLAALVSAHLAALDDKLRNLSADLGRLCEEFHRGTELVAVSGGSVGGAPLPEELVSPASIQQLVAEMECQLADELAQLGTRPVNYVRSSLVRVLRRTARVTALQALKQLAVKNVAQTIQPSARADDTIAATVRAAAPVLSGCGGRRRALLAAGAEMLPEGFGERLSAELPQPATEILQDDSDVLLCREVGEMPLRHVASRLLDGRFQVLEAAKRLHTRVDIDWPAL